MENPDTSRSSAVFGAPAEAHALARRSRWSSVRSTTLRSTAASVVTTRYHPHFLAQHVSSLRNGSHPEFCMLLCLFAALGHDAAWQSHGGCCGRAQSYSGLVSAGPQAVTPPAKVGHGQGASTMQFSVMQGLMPQRHPRPFLMSASSTNSRPSSDSLPARPGLSPIMLSAVWACVFVQMLGVGVTIATLPLFLTSMGATPTQLSLVIASFSGAQMLGCPALVALSSRIGRLPVLLLCLAGAATANVWTAMSSSMSSVTLARMLAGMFAASVPVAQAAVTDGGGQDTTSRLALISAAISSGAVVGPALAASLSAFLTARGIAAARHGPLTFLSIAVLAAGTSVVGTLCVAFSGWLRRRSAATWPEAFEAASTTTSPAAPAAQGAARSQQAALPSSAAVSDTSASETAVASFLAPRRRWSAPSLSRAQRLLLPVSWSCGWLVTLGVSTYTLFASAFLGFSQADVGALFSAGALAGVVTQILLLPRLARSIGERMCCTLGCATMGVAFAVCSLLRKQPLHAFLYLLYRVGLAVADTTTSSLLVKFSTSSESRARNLALAQSCQAAARIVGPFVSFALYEVSMSASRSPGCLPFLAAGLLALVTSVLPLLLPKDPSLIKQARGKEH